VALPFALDPWPLDLAAWGLAALMAVAAYGAQVMMAEAYGALTVGEAAIWLQLTPIAQYLLGVALLGEPVTAVGLAGVLLAVVGVAWAMVLGRRHAAGPAEPAPPASA